MTEPSEPDPAESGGSFAGDAEEVDGLPVLAGPPRIVAGRADGGILAEDRRSAVAMIPAVQAAAVAAGGFVAGAAVVGLVHRRRRRSPALPKGRRRRRAVGSGAGKGGIAGELVQIVGSRSLLVDVHLLGGDGTDR